MPNLTLHVEADTLQELLTGTVTALSAMNLTLMPFGPPQGQPPTPAEPVAEAPKPAKPAKAAKETPLIVADAPEQQAEVDQMVDRLDAKFNDEPPVTLGYDEHIKPAVLQLAEKKGRDAVLTLLADWKSKVGSDAEKFIASDIPAEHFPAFLADVEARKAA